MDAKLAGKVDIITPRDPAARGAQLSLVFRKDGKCALFVARRAQCRAISCALDAQ